MPQGMLTVWGKDEVQPWSWLEDCLIVGLQTMANLTS